ncbi:DUF4304 domain-containing protein [Novipirellula sp. SH528]|uniref:DUF4304 domain-containing protein n=1 Tax=Novipirellula sp. SH528 TaxID=3454466 RepID=UPI003F9F15C8
MSAILKDILATVAPRLRCHGYKGSGQNYRLANENAVSIVNFQKSSGGERFYVNVGVQPLFVPTEGESTPDAKRIKEPECIFRTRLDPPQDEMFGWPYSPNLAEQVAKKFDKLYSVFVEPLMTIPGPITEASVDDFDEQSVHPMLGAYHARNFLHFARISLARGNKEKAAEFARKAIEICPERATSLIHKLNETLANASP